MPQPLTPATIAIVKATTPAIAEHGTAITSAMYARLFQDEHIKALFNHANQGESGMQVHALAAAILGYARNIDNLGALAPVVERIAYKHVGYHILPEHYPYVANALLAAIKDVLGDAATDEVLAAWGEAYWFLADVLKAREVVLRDEIQAAQGGWNGWRRFVVADKIRESSTITSFILRPEDGGPVLRHKPGQYLTFRLKPASAPDLKRNYSISCGPNGEYYRISVKREADGQGGSRFLHDHVHVGDVLETTPPAGDFFLPEDQQRPIILLSGGVGLTPMVSMVDAVARDHSGLEAHYIHGTISSETHALDDHVRALTTTCPSLRVATFYSDPLPSDVIGENHDGQGFVPIEWLQANTPLLDADIFLCGPKPFLRAFVSGLALAGVPAARIHYEFFGPADELLAA
ncbi:NO-inducible flavohemoprotein [Sphingomonas crocodyli]|uniref:nitric oxide dioxygenase n=1 Tax=Sphingomonas crocodyli TaxID=1979270 RepID=A0A437LZS2_9SPHN|nr:NO-inducible flavohemoprotein [Sphingomonas crocodyli]RVT90920.1 NO-inducible flavohemoprotein [Sphingomonas crocodyli]